MKRLLALFILLASATTLAQSPVDSLVSAERAFAKKSRDTNIREAFLAYFADDGVIFTPGPTNAKEFYAKRQVPPNPPPFMLDWEPAYADVSRAGDLGFTTGPFSITDNAKHAVTDHGTFFSVWEKQKDGAWKVVLDFGVPTKAARTLRPLKLAVGSPSAFEMKPGTDASQEARRLLSEDAFLNSINPSAGSYSPTYEHSLAPNAYVVQDGLEPLTSVAARKQHLLDMKTVRNWKALGGGISKSGDLGYTYGSYQASVIGSPNGETRMGYYARIWKRDGKGSWKIVLDNTQALYAPSTPAKKT
jgi:ketosteroid isomerase-like protein